MSLAGNSFGHSFRVTTFGESHGVAVGCVIDGCPAGVSLAEAHVQLDLDRRKPGQGPLSSARQEPDEVRILSGVYEGKTLGTPIAMLIGNLDARPKAYAPMAEIYRPSHADYTYQAKYGYPPLPGGGRASARETAARVAAGAVARKLLAQAGIEIVAWVEQVAHLTAAVDPDTVTRALVAAQGAVQCPDPVVAPQMTELIEAVRADGDTVGGVIGAVARGVPAGLGDPVFDKLEATLARAMLSLPAAKGFENGSGFGGVLLRGSEHNDAFLPGPDGRLRTRTNRSGGIQGGISNGMPIVVRVAFKPVATHFKPQDTVNLQGEPVSFAARGRHDPCVLPRAVVIVEAMLALCLADAWLRQRAQKV